MKRTELPLRGIHEELGARFGEVSGQMLPRNYGDPAAEYEVVRHGAGIADRGDRVPVRVYGRDPVKMVQGLITNDIEGAPEGQGVYAAVLTAKGRMVADVRIFRWPEGEPLMDVDAAALDGPLEHLPKFVPPLSRALGAEIPADLAEEGFVVHGFEGGDVLVAQTEAVGEDGYDLFAPIDRLEALWRALGEAGGRPVGLATLDVLRIEAGRPRWGAELTEKTIPLEAGLRERAISTTKGCYTGQEVIVRILHRGHVNWHLRGIALGDAPAPPPETSLFRPGETKVVGRITSSCTSPLHGQTIALGYVRREIDPPATLRLGDGDGPEAEIFELPIPIGE